MKVKEERPVWRLTIVVASKESVVEVTGLKMYLDSKAIKPVNSILTVTVGKRKESKASDLTLNP